MSRLFLAELREVAKAVYDMAGDDETRYPEAARKILEDVGISAVVRHELAVKGLSAEAAGIAATLRRGLPASSLEEAPPNEEVPLNGDTPRRSEPIGVAVEVAAEKGEPIHLKVNVHVEAARLYLSETQRESRFGTQRRYIDFELADFENSRDDEHAKRIGHGNAEKRFSSVIRLMDAAGVDVLGDLPDEKLVKAFMTLRAD